MTTRAKYMKALAELEVWREKQKNCRSPYIASEVKKRELKVKALEKQLEGIQVKLL